MYRHPRTPRGPARPSGAQAGTPGRHFSPAAGRRSPRRLAALLICAALCALPLTGCARTLSALAEGVDRTAGALADLTGRAAEAAAAAADGLPKDALLEVYDGLIRAAGAAALTPDADLAGTRTAGADGYTGSYEARYEAFSGTEILFGGTALEGPAGGTVEITCTLTAEEGEAAVFLRSGAGEPAVLLGSGGTCRAAVQVDGGSTYVGVWGDHLTGALSLRVEQPPGHPEASGQTESAERSE